MGVRAGCGFREPDSAMGLVQSMLGVEEVGRRQPGVGPSGRGRAQVSAVALWVLVCKGWV